MSSEKGEIDSSKSSILKKNKVDNRKDTGLKEKREFSSVCGVEERKL